MVVEVDQARDGDSKFAHVGEGVAAEVLVLEDRLRRPDPLSVTSQRTRSDYGLDQPPQCSSPALVNRLHGTNRVRVTIRPPTDSGSIEICPEFEGKAT